MGQRFFKIRKHFFVIGRYPASTGNAGPLKNGIDAIFIHQATGDYFELQYPHRPQNQITAQYRSEYLNGSFFSELLQSFVQLFDFERITYADTAENFRYLLFSLPLLPASFQHTG